MLKRIFLLVALSVVLLMPSIASAAPEEGAPTAHAGSEIPEYNLVPQSWHEFVLSFYNVIWVAVIFLVLLAVLYPTAWKHVLAGLIEREKRIRTDTVEAEKATARAQATLDQYNQQIAAAEARSRELVQAAASQGDKIATQFRATAQQESEETRESALKEIEASRQTATAQVREEVGSLATMIAAKVMRRDLNQADQQELIRESLAT